MINGSIQVTVVEVRGGRVKLGFEYPEGNTVYRTELYERILAENRAAAEQTNPEKLGSLLGSFKPTKPKEPDHEPGNGDNDHDD